VTATTPDEPGVDRVNGFFSKRQAARDHVSRAAFLPSPENPIEAG
jgi:hypothetical protein